MHRPEAGATRTAAFQHGNPRSDLRAGDLVLSRDEHDADGPVEAKVVEEVFVREGLLTNLTVNGRVIRTTFEHPFFVWGRGWVPCGELQVGDRIATESGAWVAVEGVEHTGVWAPVYNIRIADYHTYFVGCDEWGFSVWAHNACNKVLNDAHEIASAAGREQLLHLSRELGVSVGVLEDALLGTAQGIPLRTGRRPEIGTALLTELDGGVTPTLRSTFETGVLDHAGLLSPAEVAARRVIVHQELYGPGVHEVLPAEAPKHGNFMIPGMEADTRLYGAAHFELNTRNPRLADRTLALPVDEFGAMPHEMAPLGYPTNALARSEALLIATGLVGDGAALTSLRSAGVVRRNFGSGGMGPPEAVVWGPLEVTPANIRSILVPGNFADATVWTPSQLRGFADLHTLANRQGIPIRYRE